MKKYSTPFILIKKRVESLQSKVVSNLKELVLFMKKQPITTLNYLLSVIIVVFIVVVLGEVIYSSKIESHYLNEADKSWNPPEKQKQTGKPFAFYRQELSKKKLFKSIKSSRSTNSTHTKTTTAPDQKEVLSKFELVGIVSGNDPSAIIKIVGLNGSIHYRIGDMVGDFSILKIEKSRVVLSRAGKEYYLKL